MHGCFWHRHDALACPLTRTPKSNLEFWQGKFEKNVERDRRAIAALRALGWDVGIVWECELKDEDTLLPALKEFLE